MPIGIDIVQIDRIKKLIEHKIPKKIYSEEEIEYISSKKNKEQTAAGIFAVKEAFLKTMEKGICDFCLNEIVVLHTQNGKPYLMLNGDAKKYAFLQGYPYFDVSITHDGNYAHAIVSTQNDEYLQLYLNAVSIFKNKLENCITPEVIHPLLPKRAVASHKGNYGRVFALAGSKGLTGAAIMACTSALKCGSGLITLGCPQSLNQIFEIALKEVMTKPLKDTDGLLIKDNTTEIIKSIKNSDVCLLGPGLGKSNSITRIVDSILSADNIYAVIDADAINAIAENIDLLKTHSSKIIMTPHIGEFSRLTGLSSEKILADTKKYALEFAQKYNVTLVLKSHRTIVASPCGRCLENILGNPGMSTGGTGDVLAGAIASFAGQKMNPFDAAITGVYIHSLSADMAAFKLGEYSLTPSDIINYLPYAIKYSSGR